ncbi:MAG: alanine racemase [Candidatus Omnitrophica bacterium]|nr:alanine racemase [Candidatus Omnitrophota bacterium]MBL7151538.1 alanine racemase [Candidatus Omnitrophota bacterium]
MNMRYYRPTWAEVNLNNLKDNFRQVKKIISPQTKVMACVKADAYGHGLVPVSKRLQAEGADFLGVASIDEGIKLRQAGIRLPILILGLVFEKDTSALFEYRLTATVCDSGLAAALNKKASLFRKPLNVHIKVDTGMGRIGVLHAEAEELVKKIHRLKFINIEGIFTHFAFAESNRDFTRYQLGLFGRLINDLYRAGIRVPLIHSANSMGVLGYQGSHFNMVRPGLVIYGLYPKRGLKIKLKPVLSLKTRVVFAKQLPPGCGISYGHTYVTRNKTNILTLPIGYGDGYPRNLSNLAPVLIRGRRLKVCGRICMDQMMVDAGALRAKVGDEAVLIGSQGKDKITSEELAELSGTIPYEIVCGLGNRIPRVYSGPKD